MMRIADGGLQDAVADGGARRMRLQDADVGCL